MHKYKNGQKIHRYKNRQIFQILKIKGKENIFKKTCYKIAIDISNLEYFQKPTDRDSLSTDIKIDRFSKIQRQKSRENIFRNSKIRICLKFQRQKSKENIFRN